MSRTCASEGFETLAKNSVLDMRMPAVQNRIAAHDVCEMPVGDHSEFHRQPGTQQSVIVCHQPAQPTSGKSDWPGRRPVRYRHRKRRVHSPLVCPSRRVRDAGSH